MSGSKKTVAIAQARMGSTRVPGKVMRDLGGQPVLRWTIEALRAAIGIDEVVLATSTERADDAIADYCDNNSIPYFRGSESDVLDRFYECAKAWNADVVLRLTCDCPFLDPTVISEVVKLREMTNADYASNINPPTFPDGLDVECFTFGALESAHREATRPSDRDCVTQFITRNRHRFKAVNLTCPLPGLDKERWVLDTEDDWKFCLRVMQNLWPRPGIQPLYIARSYLYILNIIDREPQLREINNGRRGALRNERFYEAIATEPLPPRTFTESNRLFERAIKTIPFAAQTFSKSHLQFPRGRTPLFLSHGDGARVFDVDGNDYVDLVNALLPVVIGYRDPDIDLAIRTQLDSGISFSLATELEYRLSEKLCQLIPCAEMVKFGKSGTDVTTAAVRLARAYTGRDHILVGGYHGWSDWSIGATDRARGVPRDVRELSHKIDADAGLDDGWHTRVPPETIAAIILEPNDNPERLENIRRYCTHYGIVLIFDEIITGFRYDIGGAQALFGVTPDLACFGKSMANGMPISALVGRRDIMKRMEPPDNIFYSGTFFGETLSIAAALATIKKIEDEDVIDHLWKQGTKLEYSILKLSDEYGLETSIILEGLYPRLLLKFKSDQIRSLFMETMAQNGVLIINSNNLSFAHKDAELKRIAAAYDAAFSAVSRAIKDGSIKEVEAAVAAPVRGA